MKQQKITISVIGRNANIDKVGRKAHKIGKIVAKVGAILVCGGLGGVMEEASKGAQSAGGLTIGLLPGNHKEDANPYIDIALPTTIGFARNAMVACSGDIIVALHGSHGTRSEISYALVYKKPVIDLGDWNIEGMIKVKDVKEAEKVIRKLVAQIKKERNSK